MSEWSTVYDRIDAASREFDRRGWTDDQAAVLIAALIQKGWL